MQFINLINLALLAATVLAGPNWEQSDIHDAVYQVADKSQSNRCLKAYEIFFGSNEQFLKSYCKNGNAASPALYKGHWYRYNQESIFTGESYEDEKVPFEFITKDQIKFDGVLLKRVPAGTLTQFTTLSKVTYNKFKAEDAKAEFQTLMFREGEATILKADNKPAHHGKWNVVSYNPRQVKGKLTSELNNNAEFDFTVDYINETKISFNGKVYSL